MALVVDGGRGATVTGRVFGAPRRRAAARPRRRLLPLASINAVVYLFIRPRCRGLVPASPRTISSRYARTRRFHGDV